MDADEVMAPVLFQSEVTNVLWQYVKGGYIDEQNAKITMLHILKLVDNYLETADLVVESLHESIWMDQSAYDVQYLVAARRNGATLLTKDRKLFEKARQCGVNVC